MHDLHLLSIQQEKSQLRELIKQSQKNLLRVEEHMYTIYLRASSDQLAPMTFWQLEVASLVCHGCGGAWWRLLHRGCTMAWWCLEEVACHRRTPRLADRFSPPLSYASWLVTIVAPWDLPSHLTITIMGCCLRLHRHEKVMGGLQTPSLRGVDIL